MESIKFKLENKIIKPESRFDLIKKIAIRLGDEWNDRNKGKWLGRFRGWEHRDIDSVYRSAESMAKDSDIAFSICFNWHLKKIKSSCSEQLQK